MNLTPTILNAARDRAAELFFDSRTKLQVQPRTLETLMAIQAVQTANLAPMFGGSEKDTEVELIWQKACQVQCEDTEACAPDVPLLTSGKKKYTLTHEKQAGFKLNQLDYRDNEFDFTEAIAFGLATAEARLLECAQTRIIQRLNGFAGVNEYTTGIGTVIGADTYIPAAFWNESLISELLLTMNYNQFSSGAMLTGNDAFWRAYTQARFNSGNDNGKGAMAAFDAIQSFYDLSHIKGVNVGSDISYLIGTGSVAFASKPVYSQSVEKMKEYDAVSYQSNIFPGLWINLQIFETCDSDSKHHSTFKFKPFARFDLFSNPAGCTATNTGVLALTCGNAPHS